MFSAQEARVRTQQQIKNDATNQLNKIQADISKAIGNGEFSISKEGVLKQEVKDVLADLGYIIKVGNARNESYYDISWR